MNQERILVSLDVPNRPGWALEAIGIASVRPGPDAYLNVMNKRSKSRFQVGSYNRLHGFDFGYEESALISNFPDMSAFDDAAKVAVTPPNHCVLTSIVLRKIDEMDTAAWPSWNYKTESANPFWSQFLENLPKIMLALEVLEA